MRGLIRRVISNLRENTHNYHFHTSTAPHINETTGLYNINHLKTPNGFQRFVDDAIHRSGELVDYISGMPSPAQIIRAMDEISDTAARGLTTWESFSSEAEGGFPKEKTPIIAFVLGGPGSGKGTQCAKIVENFGFTHLSAGDLLRKEISSKSENGAMILNTIKNGKIVPSELTVKLIQRAIESSKNDKFLIDGFPRSEENRMTYERIIGTEPNLVCFFDLPEEEMMRRVLSRNQGRVDDNIDTVKERLKVFTSLNLPVINHYSNKGKLYKINAIGTVDEIFERVQPIFSAWRAVT